MRVITVADELDYMLRAALLRRQLSPSQKGALVVELEQYRVDVATSGKDARAGGGLGRRLAENGARGDRRPQSRSGPLRARQGRRAARTPRAPRARARRPRRCAVARAPAVLFELIYADPPWQLGNPDSDYAPEAHYPTLGLEEIKCLPVPATTDALLYLWAVNSHLPQALEVMAAWDFEYRSNEVWVKPSIGLGVWTRNRHELLLIGRRGKASRAEGAARSVIEARRGRHAEKPGCVYERLERLYAHLSKLELFARGRPRPGWTAWGNEVEAV